MNFKYFNLRLVERKWFYIVTYDFVRKTNFCSVFCGFGIKVSYTLEGLLFDNSEIFV